MMTALIHLWLGAKPSPTSRVEPLAGNTVASEPSTSTASARFQWFFAHVLCTKKCPRVCRLTACQCQAITALPWPRSQMSPALVCLQRGLQAP